MKLLRLREVIALTSLSRMSIYRYERAGNFPRRRRLGSNSVGWLDEDVFEWMRTRPAIPSPGVYATPPRSHHPARSNTSRSHSPGRS
jgi:prophage regulatory protein